MVGGRHVSTGELPSIRHTLVSRKFKLQAHYFVHGNEDHLYVVPATNLLLVGRAKYSHTFDIRPRSDCLLELNELDQL